METLLTVDNLSVEYRGARYVQALKKVCFEVYKGDILGIIGESGSGKSTLAYSMLNLLPENAHRRGRITFAGQDIFDLGQSALCQMRGSKIGIIPQEPAASFNPVFTVGYQFNEFLALKEICANQAQRSSLMRELLKKVHLEDPERILISYPHQLSGGQLQRVMIALTIAANPLLLIADEPTSSLDVTIESQLIHMFLRLRDELGLTIVFITHNLGLIQMLCNRVIVLYRGQVREAGNKDTLLASPQDSYTKSLIASFDAIG